MAKGKKLVDALLSGVKTPAQMKAEMAVDRARAPQEHVLSTAGQNAKKLGQSDNRQTRSLEQGYEHGWYHGGTGDITSFDPNLLGESTGAASAKQGFFFARDPQNPPEHLTKKTNDPASIEMLRRAGVDVDNLNKVSFEGHGAETASGYARMGGDREYKESMRQAKSAEKRGDWSAYEKHMADAEDYEIGRMNEAQKSVAKYGEARDTMLDRIGQAFYRPMEGKNQFELEAFDKEYQQLFPYGWYSKASPEDFKRYKDLAIQRLGEDQAAPVLDAMKDFESARNERAFYENMQSGANVMPVALRYKDPLVHDFGGSTYRDETYNDLLRRAREEGKDAVLLKNTYDPGAGPSKLVDVGVVFDPSQIRSRFAAFDPEQIDSPDILKAKGGVVKMAEGGTPDQAELDRMRLELNSPVIQATPQSPIQRGIGTIGGYMDRAGQFVSKSLEPIAETHPVKHFLGELLLADTLKSAGTALQDYTKTSREYTEDNPYKRAPITGSGQTMSLDPRMLDVIGFAQPAASLGIKAGRAGVKAATPFARDVGSMASELYMSGKMPGMVAPNMYAVSPDGKPAKVLAPANESGFYSPTEAAALNLQRKSGAGQAFLNDIMKGENVRADEIKTMGLDTFLKDKKNVTADEVRDYIAQNKIQLGESVYGYRKPPEVKAQSPEDFLRFENLGEEIDSARNFEAETKAPKFESYALPGGENYREIVLTLPTKTISEAEARVILGAKPDAKLTEADINFASRKNAQEYKSSHWDEPNALAHLRVSDRVTDGKKTLLVDEVQSDWHQAGREKGYKLPPEATAPMDSEYRALVHKNADAVAKGLTPDPQDVQRAQILEQQLMQSDSSKIPDAPYKDDWYQLSLRRAIKEAIDGGYDRVALPTGDRVNERFDISKQVDSISHQKNPDSTYKIVATDKNNRHVMNEESVSEDKLASIVGKDIAQKIINAEGKPFPEGSVGAGMTKLSGLDLQVGGEGNKKYYDEIYPNYLKKFGKKYGASVGKTTVDADGVAEPLHYMDITPAMRKEFSTGIPMKRGGKVQFANNIDAMRLALSKG